MFGGIRGSMLGMVIFFMLGSLLSCIYAGCAIYPRNGHVTIPSSWTEIKVGAFSGCTSIRTVTIPDSIVKIGQRAFFYSGLTAVTIPDSVIELGVYAFGFCVKLEDVHIGNSVKRIEKGAFVRNFALKRLVIPDSVQFVDILMCERCKNLVYAIIGNGLQNVSNNMFDRNIKLTSVKLGNNVTRIGSGAFDGCEKLQSVEVGNSSTLEIQENAFRNTKSLVSLKFGTRDSITFRSCDLTGIPAEDLRFAKSLTSIVRSPFTGYACASLGLNYDKPRCGCTVGYGNVAPAESSFVTCSLCKRGLHQEILAYHGACSPCGPGRYAEEKGRASCLLCGLGKYSKVNGSSSESDCDPCEPGHYSATAGATECRECPPGSLCSKGGMPIYQACEKGAYTNSSKQTSCFACPRGRYQQDNGSAVCNFCHPGTFNDEEGSVSLEACNACPAGRYANQEGSSICQACGKDTFTATAGQHRSCTACPPGKTTTGVGASSSDTGATHCVKTKEACKPGFEPTSSSACSRCKAGSFSPLGESCLLCARGSYAPTSGRGTEGCDDCPAGRYGVERGGADLDSACKPCPAGTFVNVNGSTACFDCPPGSSCGREGMAKSDPCAVGQYTDEKLRQSCTNCPAGRYQNETGSAKCFFCARGKYLPLSTHSNRGANNSDLCRVCPPGTYGDKEGLDTCSVCPTGQIQPYEGRLSCYDCTLEGKIKTSNAARTACIDNQALLSSSVVEEMFTKGVALSLAFAIAAIFTALAGIMHYLKSSGEDTNEYGALKTYQVVLKSALPGFNFGSEVVLLMGIFREAPALGGAMVAFRLLHPCTILVLCFAIFLPQHASSLLLIRDLKGTLHTDFMKKKIPLIGVVLLTSMCDATMIQFLPWKQSTFYEESQGFPSSGVMKLCLGVKTLQALVSVVCQLIYLALNSDLNDPTMSSQGKALFGLSIALSLATLIMGMMILFLKGTLLTEAKDRGDDEVNPAQEKSEEEQPDESRPVPDFVYTSNPMLHDSTSASVSVSAGETAGSQQEVQAAAAGGGGDEGHQSLLLEISRLRQENKRLREQMDGGGEGASKRLAGFGSIAAKRNSLERRGSKRSSLLASDPVPMPGPDIVGKGKGEGEGEGEGDGGGEGEGASASASGGDAEL